MEANILRATKIVSLSLNNHIVLIEKALQYGVTCKYEFENLVNEFKKKVKA